MSDSPIARGWGGGGLVKFAIRVVNMVLNLPDGQVKFFGEFKLKNCNKSCSSKSFWGSLK